MAGCCKALLSEGLDLCVRARKIAAQERTNAIAEASPDTDLERLAARTNAATPEFDIMTRCATIPVWLQDQYDRDLLDWETRARHHLMQGCRPQPKDPS